MIISYCSEIQSCVPSTLGCNKIKVQKYYLDYTTNIFKTIGNIWEIQSDNRYISCVEMGEDYQYKITCLYVAGDCKEQVTIFQMI